MSHILLPIGQKDIMARNYTSLKELYFNQVPSSIYGAIKLYTLSANFVWVYPLASLGKFPCLKTESVGLGGGATLIS